MKISQYWANLKYKWMWLNILNSPFKTPRLQFYFGKVERGVPYFLPRRWKKLTYTERVESVNEDIERNKKAYERAGKEYKKPDKEKFNALVESKKGTQRAHPTKWQIKSIGLGYKYKWDSPRHEWNPQISIVGFNRQFCIYFGLKDSMINMCYWEGFLYYRHETKGTKRERIEKCKKDNPISWGSDKEGYTNYYPLILKKKYL